MKKTCDILAIIIIITSIVSKLSINIIAIPLIILWIITAYIESPKKFSEFFLGNKKVVLCIYIWLLTSIFLYFIKNTFMTSYELKNIFRIAVNLLIFGYYFYLKDKNRLEFLYNISIITIIIYSILTVKELISNPYISRILSTGYRDKYLVKNKFIGGYDFAYGLTFILIPYIYIIIELKLTHNINKFISIVVFFILTVTLLYQQFTISIILLVIGLILNLLKVSKVTSVIIWTTVIIITINAFSNGLIYLLDTMSNNLNQEVIAEKINELSESMKDRNVNSTVDFKERIKRYKISLEEFINDPFAFNENKKIGSHSELLDEYAKYGIVVASVTTLTFYQYIKFIYLELNSNEKKRIWFCISIVYVLFNLINNTMFISTSLMIFFVTPSVVYLSKERKKENEDSLDC